MATKKRLTKRKRKLRLQSEQAETVKLISEQQLLERKQKYLQRLRDIRISTKFVRDGLNEYKELMDDQVAIHRWERYLSCDGLPKPHCPQDIRFFIKKLQYLENVNVDDTVHWTLPVNERSVLTQDIFSRDLTRNTLERDTCPNIGANYDQQISLYLSTLDLIEHLLDNEIELSQIELARSKEIVAIKTEVENEIVEAFDRFTYRIVSAMDAYMTTIDGIEANYSYNGRDFDIHIWALREVPIRFEQMQFPFMIAKMKSVGIEVQIPLSCLSHHLTLRCVHSFFDPLTPNAKSFQQVITKPTDNIIAGVSDIEEALVSEWILRLELMDEVRTKMMQSRLNYEENLKAYEQKLAAIGKSSKASFANKNYVEKSKMPKLPKEVPALADDMYPDVESLYLEREKKHFDEFMHEFYHPDVLHLKEGEINLKKFIILGGTYNLCYVQGPKYTDFKSYTITNHVEGRKLNVLKEIIADLNFLDDNDSLQHKQSHFLLTPNEEVKSTPISTEFEELPYFLVTFQLPRHLCIWGVPIVCQYEECELEDTKDSCELVSDLLIDFHNKAKSIYGVGSNFLKDQMEGSTNEPDDNTPNLSLNRFATTYDATRLSSNIYRSRLPELLRFSVLPKRPWEKPAKQNFDLGGKLSKTQIATMTRYCLPSLVSSFKFPLEINEEALEDITEQQAQRQKPLTILRRQDNNKEDDTTVEVNLDADFNYEQQTNPERVFPIFAKNKFHNFVYDYYDFDEPNTICSLIRKVEDIREKYTSNCKKILDQKPYGFIEKKEIKKLQSAVFDLMGNQTREAEPRKTTAKVDSKQSIESRNTPSIRKLRGIKGNVSRTMSTDGGRFSEAENINTTSKSKIRNTVELLDTDAISVTSRFSESQQSSKIEHEAKLPPALNSHHWTSEHIVKSTLDTVNLTITVQTDRLGIFGFAYKRYSHFPFRNWSLEPNPEKPNALLFTLDTFHVRVILNITNEGYTGYVTDLVTAFIAKPVKYLSIEEPITEFNELRKRFLEKNVNIFAEHDAPFYIDQGYFSVKHLSTELHIYEIFALHCFLVKFYHSHWNRLATRRNLVFCFKDPKEKDESLAVTVRVTPENATFVEISEHCSDNLDVFVLDYKPTWRNINEYADLHHLINSMYPAATDIRNRDAKLLYYVTTLFNKLRPLSYS